MEQTPLEGIAVIGMAGRFPGARDLSAFWRNLCEGVESITFFTREELAAAGIDDALLDHPNYIKARGVIGDTDLIDAGLFGLHPREASLMDPQHRLFLECSWEAFEDAGYSVDQTDQRVGVFAGQSMNTYLLTNIYGHLTHVASVDSLQASIGNDKDSLTTEVAYRLNLRGPAVTVQSSSSTSLVAVHYACQSLLNYECDMALAGGVSIHFPEKAGYMYHDGGTTASDGHCHTFDAAADGFVAGHGAGVVVLKRLEDAAMDGDQIYVAIKGSAVNNDGSVKVSYMAPSVDGQADVIAMAQAISAVEPDTIGYVEAHGTGTKLGDPIEVAALTQAFQAGTTQNQFCALGSVKTNIGHLDAAAGVAGLIKTVLAIRHNQIPPSLNYQSPNPNIDFANSPFYVNTSLRPWPERGSPRRAGVTSLGMGGTNAHMIVEEAPPVEPSGPSRAAHLLMLSAHSETALDTATANLVRHLEQHPDVPLADIAYTLQVGRRHFRHRRMVVAHDHADAIALLGVDDSERVFGGMQETRNRRIVFLFSGQGTQYVGMGRDLYDAEPVFRSCIDTCCERLTPLLGLDLRSVLFAPADEREHATHRLEQTALAQPALFVVEYALAQLLSAWSIQPQAMIGHSIGEYVAACLAGVLSLDDALRLVAARGRLMQAMPSGAMLAVQLAEPAVAPYIDDLSIAAVNAPALTVLSGPTPAVVAVQQRLDADGVRNRRLRTSHAFHSAMMEPMLDDFAEVLHGITFHTPTIPYVSNVTGMWITSEQATDPQYWTQHLRRTVRFANGVPDLIADPDAILLEIGPGHTLTTLVRQHTACRPEQLLLSSLRHPNDQVNDLERLLTVVGRLWLAGHEMDWQTFHGDERRCRVSLPTYPFERQRYWIDPPAATAQPVGTSRADEKLPADRWLYLPTWRRTLAQPASLATTANWLVFAPADDAPVATHLVERLVEQGQTVTVVQPGATWAKPDECCYRLVPANVTHYATLFDNLALRERTPAHIIHLWNSGTDEGTSVGIESLIALVQAIGTSAAIEQVRLTVATTHATDVSGAEPVDPERAAVVGFVKVIAQEYPHIRTACLDASLDHPWCRWLADQLIATSISDSPPGTIAAIRGQQRFAQAVEPVVAPAASTPLRDDGVYLITGGFGTIGAALAETLARSVRPRLALLGRSQLPPLDAWGAWLASRPDDNAISRRIHQIRALEALGATVLPIVADVTDQASMRAARDVIIARFGTLHGVIHAAGTVDTDLFRTIGESAPSAMEHILKARVRALEILEHTLNGYTLDFCILSSSLAAQIGGRGLGMYAASARYTDAFAHRCTQRGPTTWTSINWDGWLSAVQSNAVGAPSSITNLALTTPEGMQVFAQVLGLLPLAQVIVSTGDLDARIATWHVATPAATSAPSGIAQERVPRPNVQTRYVAPRNEREESIAQVWQDVLGIDRVGIHDNFFDLGGNSLAGVQVIDRLKQQYGIQILAVSLYEGPTVRALVRVMEEAEGTAPSPEDERSQQRGERRRERMLRQRQPAKDN